MMEIRDFYSRLLELVPPWTVKSIVWEDNPERMDVFLECGEAALFPCPECGRPSPVCDRSPLKTWRHLDTCGKTTHLLAGLPIVVEVRHVSWDSPEVRDELSAAGAGIVNVDQPLFRDSVRPSARVTSPVAYVRVHGRNYKDWFRKNAGRDARYDYLYTEGELEPWARRIGELAGGSAPGADADDGGDPTEEPPDVYVVTNNHFRGQAAANAKMLESMVEHRKVEAPAEGAIFEIAVARVSFWMMSTSRPLGALAAIPASSK